MAEAPRVCVFCGRKISSLRSKASPFCSTSCNNQSKESEKVLIHSCISDPADMYRPGCSCKKRVSKKKAIELLQQGQCVTLDHRSQAFDGGPLLFVQGSGRTPRVGMIEKPHVERGTQGFSPSAGIGTRTRTIDEIQKLLVEGKMEEDDITPGERERIRWDEYHRLDIESFVSMTTVLPAVEYDRIRYEQWGRQWSCTIRENKNRDRGAVGKDVSPRLLQPEEPDVFTVVEREDEPRKEQEAEEDLGVLVGV